MEPAASQIIEKSVLALTIEDVPNPGETATFMQAVRPRNVTVSLSDLPDGTPGGAFEVSGALLTPAQAKGLADWLLTKISRSTDGRIVRT